MSIREDLLANIPLIGNRLYDLRWIFHHESADISYLRELLRVFAMLDFVLFFGGLANSYGLLLLAYVCILFSRRLTGHRLRSLFKQMKSKRKQTEPGFVGLILLAVSLHLADYQQDI